MSAKVLKGVSSSSSPFLAPELVAGSQMGRCIGVSSSCAAAALGPSSQKASADCCWPPSEKPSVDCCWPPSARCSAFEAAALAPEALASSMHPWLSPWARTRCGSCTLRTCRSHSDDCVSGSPACPGCGSRRKEGHSLACPAGPCPLVVTSPDAGPPDPPPSTEHKIAGSSPLQRSQQQGRSNLPLQGILAAERFVTGFSLCCLCCRRCWPC